MLLKREQAGGVAETEVDPNAVEMRMFDYVKFVPQPARSMGIRIEAGGPNAADIARVAKDRLFVKIKLKN